MNKYFQNFECHRKKGQVLWIGDIQPTAMSNRYRIRIIYSLVTSPKASLIYPQLVKRQGTDKIPHTYYDGFLCLYFPKAKEWTRDMLISKTIVPWTALWLYYYEVWHATGCWLGGGVHPTKGETQR